MGYVIGPEYCSSSEVNLAVVRKVLPRPESTIFVGDKNNNIIFEVIDTTFSYGFHWRRALLDKDRQTILSFRHKQMSLHHRWLVYRGSSKSKSDLLFSAKQSSMFGNNRELEVFLASNEDEKICDYKVGGSSQEFYAVDSNGNYNIIAEMDNGYTVKIYPNFDQAFIISLIAILDGIYRQQVENRKKRLKAVSSGIKIGKKLLG